MYPVSSAYKTALKKPIHRTHMSGRIGNARIFTEDDFTSLTINHRCADNNEVTIGSVYMAELNITMNSAINILWLSFKGTPITLTESLVIGEDTVESVPVGTFYIDEIKRTKEGYNIIAYDAMSKFDKQIRKGDIATANKTMPALLADVCNKCGVELATEDFEQFPNHTGIFTLASDSDVETYRDLISWIAQTLCAYATINREGKLEIRMYPSIDNVADGINAHTRADSYTFSSFRTYYTGLRATDEKRQISKYYHVEDDTGLTYNIGNNPFLRKLSADRFDAACENILNGLQNINYTPYSIDILPTMVYDLGDIIDFVDGAGFDTKGCVMAYNYTYNQSTNLEGLGSDPFLSTAKSKTDKNISGIMKKTEESKEYLYEFFNAEDIELSSTWQTVFSQRFATVADGHAIFQAEILCNDPAGSVTEVKYMLDGEELSRYPIETWIAGRHIMPLFYVIPTKEGSSYLWQVQMKSNANVTILENEGYGTIRGQGLASTDAWNGYIDVSDEYTIMSTLDDADLLTYTETSVTAVTQLPTLESITEDFDLLDSVDDSEVKHYVDVYAFNQDFLNQITWDEAKLHTWDYTEVNYVWGIDLE